MNNTLVHRGPDDEGYYFEDDLGLGMRRLSIIDVEGGNQPVHNEDRSVWIVFNGEIYNYLELREELRRSGHTFYTESDTETIVHMYEDYGERCLQKLNGMFSFALWDVKRRRLFVARDRLGIKPLYYYADEQRICFASELKALLRCPLVPRHVDTNALVDYLTFMYIRAPRTPFHKVHKLLPGHYLSCENGRMEIQHWWSLADYCEPTSLSESEIVNTTRELLHDSVRLRLRSDVPVGAFLSGGVDSSAVAGYAAQLLTQPLATFSVGFPNDGINELGYARSAAMAFHTDHHELVVSVQDAIEHLPKLVWHLDEPNADSAIVPTYLVSRLAASKMRVILSGLGGDELFAGYGRYFGGRSLARLYRRIPAPFRRDVILPLVKRVSASRHARMLVSEQPDYARYLAMVGMFSHDEIASLFGDTMVYPRESLKSLFDVYPAQDRVNQMLFVDSHTYLPDDILALTDRVSMAESLETRTPFLDYRLVQFAAGVPGRYKLKLRGRKSKIVLKQAVSPFVPQEIVHRGKWGFGAPVGAWMGQGLHSSVRDLYRESAVVDSGLLNAAAVEEFVNAARNNGESSLAQKLWALLVLEIWFRVMFKDEMHVAPSYTLTDLING